MATAEQEIVPDLIFDYQTIAEQVRQFRKGRKQSVPNVATLATSITGMTFSDTIYGSSTLEIEVVDRDWELLEFFEIDQKGRISPMDFNYPLDSANWWRLSSLDLTGGVDGERFRLTCMERPVAWLLHKHGPKKSSRGKHTRAEFIKSLSDSVKAGRGLKFSCSELHKKQDVVGGGKPTTTKQDKTAGFPADVHFKIAKGSASKHQIELISTCLDIAEQLHAPDDAVKAMLCAGTGESGWSDSVINKYGFGGVFQGQVNNGGHYFAVDDTEAMCRSFLKGGKGYQAGGAIAAAKAHKDWSPGTIAYKVEGCRSNFASDALAEKHYQQWIGEAEDILSKWSGGFSGGKTSYRQQFNFEVGDQGNPHETYWDAMTRLAEDVRWRLFVAGRTIYFDTDMALIQQRPAYTVARTDPAVLSYQATWDDRRIATEMELVLIVDPFAYRAGDVFKLEDFGPLSTCSTAKVPQPGFWLITDIVRSSGDLSSTFTLKQPELPRREPRADIGTRDKEDESTGSGVGDLSDDMTPKEVIDELVLPIGRQHKAHAANGGTLNAANVKTSNDNHPQNTSSGNKSDHKGPPNVAYAADMGFGGVIDSPNGDALADELALVFKMTGGKLRNHVYAFGVVDATHKGFRFQLGWRVEGHHDHVHFGVKRIATTPAGPGGGRPDIAGNPNVSSP